MTLKLQPVLKRRRFQSSEKMFAGKTKANNEYDVSVCAVTQCIRDCVSLSLVSTPVIYGLFFKVSVFEKLRKLFF